MAPRGLSSGPGASAIKAPVGTPSSFKVTT